MTAGRSGGRVTVSLEFMRAARSEKAKRAPWHAFYGVLGSDGQRSLCGHQRGMGNGLFFNVHMGPIPRYNDGSFCVRCLELTDQLVAHSKTAS